MSGNSGSEFRFPEPWKSSPRESLPVPDIRTGAGKFALVLALTPWATFCLLSLLQPG